MHKINQINMNYTPRTEIMHRLSSVPGEPEMTEAQSAFLCGLLDWKRPRKIVEVGVAAGGTTAIIMQCMENLKTEYEIFSVDKTKE